MRRLLPFLISPPDIFGIAGQSNASGRGTNNQSYSHPTLSAYFYGNDYVYKNLTDPVDSATNQVDAVSADAEAAGSCWPLLATAIMAASGASVAFVPCAAGSTAIADWQPSADHEDRATLYGSMIHRLRGLQYSGNLKAVLWWQGERDATLGTAEATYNAALDILANSLYVDTGLRLIVCKIEDLSGYEEGYDAGAVNSAIATAWADNANVLQGPDFSDITPSVDGVHFKTDAELQEAADRWWTALEALFYS